MPAEVGVRVGGHDAGLTTPPHTVSPPPSPPRLSIPHLICQLSALPDARFGGRDENCGLDAGGYCPVLALAPDHRAGLWGGNSSGDRSPDAGGSTGSCTRAG